MRVSHACVCDVRYSEMFSFPIRPLSIVKCNAGCRVSVCAAYALHDACYEKTILSPYHISRGDNMEKAGFTRIFTNERVRARARSARVVSTAALSNRRRRRGGRRAGCRRASAVSKTEMRERSTHWSATMYADGNEGQRVQGARAARHVPS